MHLIRKLRTPLKEEEGGTLTIVSGLSYEIELGNDHDDQLKEKKRLQTSAIVSLLRAAKWDATILHPNSLLNY